MITKALIGMLILLAGYNVVAAQQGYLGIVPMQSTCEDVKRILNVSTCDPPDNTFDLGKEKLRIRFTKMPCEKAWAENWNVQIGSVIIIERFPKETLKLSDLQVDLSKYTKIETDFVLEAIYVNEDEGISVDSVEGDVREITYAPATKKNRHLLCSNDADSEKNKNRIKLPIHEFERYRDISLDEEKLVLKYVVKAFKQWPSDSIIYVVAQPGDGIDEKSAGEKAENTKSILVKNFNIDEKRIVTVVADKDKYFDTFYIKIYIDGAKRKKTQGK